MSALEDLDAERTLEFLFSKVRSVQQLADQLDPHLALSWRRMDLESETGLDGSDVVAMLINAAVGVAQCLATQGRDEASGVMELVDHYSGKLFTRIGYLVLAEAGQHLPERVDQILRSEELRDPGFPATEIAVLLRSQFGNASPEVRKEYVAAVETGPNREELSTRCRRLHGRDPTEEEIHDYMHDYQRRILTFFRGDIPDEFRGACGKTRGPRCDAITPGPANGQRLGHTVKVLRVAPGSVTNLP